jgi:hypothetical protein
VWLGAAHAASTSQRFCDRPLPLSAQQQDRLLQVAALVRRELEASGDDVALISRSGLNLQRFGIRYSHAGLSLKTNDGVPWSVRQLYYACDERRPRLFDQGLAGFLFGTDDPEVGYVSIVWMPKPQAAEVERAAQDKARALRLISARYSANAYPFSLRYQNCNQWVAELLATAWVRTPICSPAPSCRGSATTTIRPMTATRCAFAPACRRRSKPSCATALPGHGASSCATMPGRW